MTPTEAEGYDSGLLQRIKAANSKLFLGAASTSEQLCAVAEHGGRVVC